LVLDRASGAEGPVRSAEVLTVLDEERIERNPIPLVHAFPQLLFGLLWRSGVHDAEPVRDPMDVGVDRDRGDPVAEDEDAVRGLRSDPGQRDELLEGSRDLAAEPVEQVLCHGPDDPRLHTIEAGRADPAFHLGGVGPGERRSVRETGEELRARDVGVRIPGALGEDRADEHLERILGVVP
jgi:hypothetical protein